MQSSGAGSSCDVDLSGLLDRFVRIESESTPATQSASDTDRKGGDAGGQGPVLQVRRSVAPRLDADSHPLAKSWLLTCLPLWLTDQGVLVLWLATASLAGPSPEGAVVWELVSRLGMQFAVALSVCHLLVGLYPGTALSWLVELGRIAQSVAAACLVLLTMQACLQSSAIWHLFPGTLVALVPLLCLSLIVAQGGARRLVRRCLGSRPWWGERAVVLADDERGIAVYRALHAHPEFGLRPVGIVADSNGDDFSSAALEPIARFEPLDAAPAICSKLGASFAVVALSRQSPGGASRLLDKLVVAIPHFVLLSGADSSGRQWRGGVQIDQLNFLRNDDRLLRRSGRCVKRCLDFVLALTAGVLLLPVMLSVCLLIKWGSPGAVLLSQERIGRGGRRFRCWKFRTMVADAESVLHEYLEKDPALRAEWESNRKLKNDPRVISVGAFLRKSGFDELPQLWNVIRGEMSLVGPRPIFVDEIERYADRFGLYCRVLPGLTGLWQVSGHSKTTYERRIELDCTYVRNWSLLLDFCILVRTIKVVLERESAW